MVVTMLVVVRKPVRNKTIYKPVRIWGVINLLCFFDLKVRFSLLQSVSTLITNELYKPLVMYKTFCLTR